MSGSLHRRRALEIWPAFVDATASLLMVVIFALLIASVGQLFLTSALSGRDAALGKLNSKVAELADQLSMESDESARLLQLLEIRTASLSSSEQALRESSALAAERAEIIQQSNTRISDQERALAEQRELLATVENEIAALTTLRDSLQQELETIVADRDDVRTRLSEEEKVSLAAKAQMEHLNRQLAELTLQLTNIGEALDIAEADSKRQQTVIDDLGRRLNLALTSKARQLERYRSEFFGQLREVLSDYPDVRVVGDRFVLPSSLLFESASDELEASGRAQIEQLANTLSEIAKSIPEELDWVLRVDGHTDKRSISTDRFASNWELSSARAITIVRALVEHGLPARRFAATGFAEYHPIDVTESPAAYARNRRIELKLTSR